MKIYRRFLASYLAVCLIPLLLSFFTIVKLERNEQASMIEDQHEMIENVQAELVRSLTDAGNAAEIITQNTTIARLGNQYDLSIQEVFDLVGLIDILSTPIDQQSVFDSSFCYFFRNQFMVSDVSTYHSPLLNIYTDARGVDETAFFSMLEDNQTLGTVRMIEGKNGDGYLVVLRNIYDSRYKEKLACVGIMLRLDKLFAPWSGGETEVFLTDEAGNLLYGSEKADQLCRTKAVKKAKNETVRLLGEDYLYSVYPFDQGIQYGFLTSKKSYYQNVREARITLAVQLVLLCAGGVALALFLSKKTWSPIEGILLFMTRSSGEKNTSDEEKSKLKYQTLEGLADALKEVVRERGTLENRLIQVQERVNTDCIARYLTGASEDSSALSQYLEEGQSYRVLLFVPIRPEISDYFSGVGQEDFNKTLHVLHFAMRNIIEETLLDIRGGFCLEMTDSVVLLAEEPIHEADIEKSVRAVKKALDVALSCYVSNECFSLSYAPAAWKRVRYEYAQEIFWQGVPRADIRYIGDETPNTDYKDSYEFLEQQQKLAGLLSAGKYPKARKCLDEMLEGLLKKDLSAETVRYRYWGIAEILVSCLPEGAKIPDCKTVWEMKNALTEIFESLAGDEEEPAFENKNTLWVKEVQEYIRENFRNPALNASMIADHFGLTLSTFSRRYKNAAGHGILDELHMVRLEAAKKLLEDGVSVSETAEKTGYVESRAMIRAFKRYEGMTPGQYAGR